MSGNDWWDPYSEEPRPYDVLDWIWDQLKGIDWETHLRDLAEGMKRYNQEQERQQRLQQPPPPLLSPSVSDLLIPPPKAIVPPPVHKAPVEVEPQLEPTVKQPSATPPSPKQEPALSAQDLLAVRWSKLVGHPGITLILGGLGAGKTVIGYFILESLRNRAAAYVVGPSQLSKYLPDWIGIIEDLDQAPDGAVIMVDEAYLKYSARSSMSEKGRTLARAVNLSRQHNQSIVFITQSARQLDLDALSQINTLVVKATSSISKGFERKEIRPLMDRAREALRSVLGDQRGWNWVSSDSADFEGLVENPLPSFWKPSLSTAIGRMIHDERPLQRETRRMGGKPSRAALAKEVRRLREKGYSVRQIAEIMGIPKSTVHDLLKVQG